MKARLDRLRMRDLALLVVVAGGVAVAAVFAAREAGLAGPWAGGAPLTLTLSATEICETTRGRGADWATLWVDDEGNERSERIYLGHFAVADAPVDWRVTGGTGPYTLVIDGLRRDHTQEYAGAGGTAWVGCAITTVESFFWSAEGEPDQLHRAYRSDPGVDSGWKTVRAVVTDANGDTAEATAKFYVVLDLRTGNTGDILRRGETYRAFGRLITAPAKFDLKLGSIWEIECREDDPNPRCGEQSYDFGLVGADAGIALYDTDGTLASRWNREVGAADASRVSAVYEALREVIASLGKPPQLVRGQP